MRSILRSLFPASCSLLLAASQTPTSVTVGSVVVPLPPGAVVVPHPHGRGHFGGVRVRLEERLVVEVAALPPSALPLREYLDSLVRSRNARARPAWRLAPPVARQVAGGIAWVLRPTCGDCQAVEVYLDFPGTRLVADWGVDGIEPLTAAQRHALAWAFVETFRADATPSGTAPSPSAFDAGAPDPRSPAPPVER